ncbi:MAG: hypothetical protein ACI9JM_002323 [Halioglobus sp.]|jgi:hypothetical protein
MQDKGKWYFRTREGTVEGPYSDEIKATEGLESYVAVTRLQFRQTDTVLGFNLALPPTVH